MGSGSTPSHLSYRRSGRRSRYPSDVEPISSSQNPLLKRARAVARGREDGQVLLEGELLTTRLGDQALAFEQHLSVRTAPRHRAGALQERVLAGGDRLHAGRIARPGPGPAIG